MASVTVQKVDNVENLKRRLAHARLVVKEEHAKLARIRDRHDGVVESKLSSIEQQEAEIASIEKALDAAQNAVS